LGICYLDGVDVSVDSQKAFQLLSAAAHQRVSRAVVNLARMYAEGLGTPKNIGEAVRLYEAVVEVEFFAPVELAPLLAWC